MKEYADEIMGEDVTYIKNEKGIKPGDMVIVHPTKIEMETLDKDNPRRNDSVAWVTEVYYSDRPVDLGEIMVDLVHAGYWSTGTSIENVEKTTTGNFYKIFDEIVERRKEEKERVDKLSNKKVENPVNKPQEIKKEAIKIYYNNLLNYSIYY